MWQIKDYVGGCRALTSDSSVTVDCSSSVPESEKISLRFLAVYYKDRRGGESSSLRKETKKGHENSKIINGETMIVKKESY